MTRRVIQRPEARRDLLHHYAYIAEFNPQAAEKVYAAAERALENLLRMPESGSMYESDNPRLTDLRFWPIVGYENYENYVIYYRPIRDGIEVVRVLHAAQDRQVILGG